MLLAPFKRALARQPASTLMQGLTTSQHLGVPDYGYTLEQFDAYIEALRSCGLDVNILPADESFPDGHYVEDTAVIFREMAFLCRPPNPSRAREIASIAASLKYLHLVHPKGGEACIEGGDVLFCADRVLIGISSRTNRTGAEQLGSALRDVQADIRVDFVPFEGVLHLKTGLTALADGLLLRSCHIRTDYRIDFADTVTLTAEESYAADVLPINDAVFIPEGYPTVEKLATQHYANVISLNMTEFEKMDGGLTCLSLRY